MITIKNLTDATQSTIDITDSSQVSIGDSQLIISPAFDLLAGKDYSIQVSPTALDDFAGNSFGGITDDTTWNFSVAPLTKPVVLVGEMVQNGNFNSNPGTTVTFNSTDDWHNTKGGQSQVATRSDVNYDGSQNGTLTGGRGFGVATQYTIVEGHSYDISYVWKDDWNWVDNTDEVTVSLFVTSDDTITGTRTNLVTHYSGTSNNGAYVSVSEEAVHTASATHEGKILFAAIETTSTGFARIDNFQLIANVPSLFATWINGYSVGGLTDPNDNPDGDAMSNLEEFAFGTDPTVSDPGPLAVDGSVNGAPRMMTPDGGLTFELVFIRRVDHGTSGSLKYTVQFGSDLETFSDVDTNLTVVADSSENDNYQLVKIPYPPLLPNSQSALFGRLKVEEIP